MDISNKLRFRNILVTELKKEFIGPGSESVENIDEEVERISESPLRRYFVGIIYPQKAVVSDSDYEDEKSVFSGEDEDDITEEESEDESNAENNEDINVSKNDDEYFDYSITSANEYCPSSYGMTFFITGKKYRLNVKLLSARYSKLVDADSFSELRAEDEFLKLFRKNEFFEINDNKFYYKRQITKDERKEIKTFCGELFLKTLDDQKADFIRNEINLNHFYNLTDDERNKYNHHYLIFSRIYDKAKNFKIRGYKRKSIDFEIPVLDLEDLKEEDVIDVPGEHLQIYIKNRAIDKNGIKKITISVLNNNKIEEGGTKYDKPELSYFQNHLSILTDNKDTSFIEISKLRIGISKEIVDDLIYRNKKVYGSGHGCSVKWEGNQPNMIQSDFLPAYEVPKTDTNPMRIENLNLKIFSMKNLAFHSYLSDQDAFKEMNRFLVEYENWLEDSPKDVPAELKGLLNKNKSECSRMAGRIRNGINLIYKKDNQKVLKAFKLMNLAMLIQRANTEKYFRRDDSLSNLNNELDNYKSTDEKLITWRPFQLAFILLNIESIIDQESLDRRTADLLWFPTGGGKTEAYLGIIAFTIFYRRLINLSDSGGTAVIMRYTLRLLTTQQFQRASTLITACEFIRKKLNDPLLGSSKISIGLWVGKDNTPNVNSEAVKIVNELTNRDNLNKFKVENPFQLSFCPFCNTSLLNEKHPILSGYVTNPKFHFKCLNRDCAFNDELPIQVVDELIYKDPPTLLFATVDKFARLAWDADTKSLFGYSKKSQRINRPPDLILQDELHLISGPLGSMFGLYESIIDYLCIDKGIVPKIICSTATVKKAEEQIKSLFNRPTDIFPPTYNIAEDSFFSKEIPVETEPGRLYVGLMSVGQTQESTQVKAYYTLLYNNYSLIYSDKNLKEDADTYYTLVSYFNTIRELGKATSLLDDDVKEKIQMMQDRRREIIFRPLWYKELTSRIRSQELPIILNQLETSSFDYKNPSKSIPVVLSSNMFSVGIDIGRLNLMLVNGQPKTTSEYIQSTSRVGRNDPGLIITLFNGYRPRDKSHYENFKAYHSSFYRYVEPTGVTPFSLQSRGRALHTIIVMYSRLVAGLSENNNASLFDEKTVRGEFKEYIRERINTIDPEEVNQAMQEFENKIDEWKIKSEGLVYSLNKYMNDKFPLMRDYSSIKYTNEYDAWPVLQSLRNVDVPTKCRLEE